MQRGIPDPAKVIFERSGHYPFAEENGAFQDVVRHWAGLNRRVSEVPISAR